MYQVAFEDNYENIFFTDVETDDWIEQDLGFTSLAALVGAQISLYEIGGINVQEPRKINWICLEDKNRLMHFGFYHYWMINYPLFEIYSSNRRCIFTMLMISKEIWQVFKFQGDSNWEAHDQLLNDLSLILENNIQKL